MSGPSATAPGRSSTPTGTSSTSMIRWPEAIARCITEYCIVSERIGSKKRWM